MSARDARQAPQELWITGDPEADHLLTTSGNALLVGMVLGQQVRRQHASGRLSGMRPKPIAAW